MTVLSQRSAEPSGGSLRVGLEGRRAFETNHPCSEPCISVIDDAEVFEIRARGAAGRDGQLVGERR